jgi:S-(hydroxymethyl)glutathione dehydrogenase / alcohol dehydrogenase
VLAPVLYAPKTPIRLEEVELDAPRAGEVRVRMTASGVCHSCLHVLDGSVAGSPMPIVLGDEGAGIVSAVGPGVTAVAEGDHVIISWAPTCGTCRYCTAGRPVLCSNQPPFGFLGDGSTRMHGAAGDVHHYGPATYAPEIVVPASCAIPVRKEMPLDVAALIGCSVMTGIGAVTKTAKVPVGASVAVFGCGGIGLNAVQGAVLSSANPIIAVDIADTKLEHAEAMGATHCVRADGDVPAEIRRITGDGAQFAVVAVGSPRALEAAWESVAPGGTVVMVGVMSDGDKVDLRLNRLIGQEVRLIGSRYGSAVPSTDFGELVDLYLAGRLRIDQLITKRYPLADINEAHRALAAGEHARSLLVFDA